MDILMLEKALHAVKTIMMISMGLNFLAIVLMIIGYIEGGKFNVKL